MARSKGMIPRANPSELEARYGMAPSFQRQSTTDVIYDAGKAVLSALAFVVTGSLILRDSGFTSQGKAIIVGSLSVVLGIAIRRSFPIPAMGLMVGGGMTLALPIFDSVAGATKTVFSPSGAALPSPSNTSVGFWEARSAFNSGKSVVVPVD
jgi:hypothetical protein